MSIWIGGSSPTTSPAIVLVRDCSSHWFMDAICFCTSLLYFSISTSVTWTWKNQNDYTPEIISLTNKNWLCIWNRPVQNEISVHNWSSWSRWTYAHNFSHHIHHNSEHVGVPCDGYPPLLLGLPQAECGQKLWAEDTGEGPFDSDPLRAGAGAGLRHLKTPNMSWRNFNTTNGLFHFSEFTSNLPLIWLRFLVRLMSHHNLEANPRLVKFSQTWTSAKQKPSINTCQFLICWFEMMMNCKGFPVCSPQPWVGVSPWATLPSASAADEMALIEDAAGLRPDKTNFETSHKVLWIFVLKLFSRVVAAAIQCSFWFKTNLAVRR